MIRKFLYNQALSFQIIGPVYILYLRYLESLINFCTQYLHFLSYSCLIKCDWTNFSLIHVTLVEKVCNKLIRDNSIHTI